MTSRNEAKARELAGPHKRACSRILAMSFAMGMGDCAGFNPSGKCDCGHTRRVAEITAALDEAERRACAFCHKAVPTCCPRCLHGETAAARREGAQQERDRIDAALEQAFRNAADKVAEFLESVGGVVQGQALTGEGET